MIDEHRSNVVSQLFNLGVKLAYISMKTLKIDHDLEEQFLYILNKNCVTGRTVLKNPIP